MDEREMAQDDQNQEEEQVRAVQEAARKQQMQQEQQSEQQQMQQMQSSLSESQKEMDEETEEEMDQSNEQEIDEGEQASEMESSEFSSGQQQQSQEASPSEKQQESQPLPAQQEQQTSSSDLSKQFQEQMEEAKENGLENGHDAESLQKQFDSMQNDIGNSSQKQMIKELKSRNEAFDEKGMSAYDGIEEKAQSIGRVGAERDLKAAEERMVENPEIGNKEAIGRMNVIKNYKQFTQETGANQERKDVSKDLGDNMFKMEHERNVQSLDRSIEQIGSTLKPGEKSDKIEIGDDHYMEIAKGKDGKLDVLIDGKSVNDMEKESQSQEIHGQTVEGKEADAKSTETYSREQTISQDKNIEKLHITGGKESYAERSDGSAEYSANYELDKKLFKDGPNSMEVNCTANKDGSYDITAKAGGKEITTHFPDKESFEKSMEGKMIESRVADIQKNDPQSPLRQASERIKKGLESPSKEGKEDVKKAFEEYGKKPFTPQVEAKRNQFFEKHFMNQPETFMSKTLNNLKTMGKTVEKGAQAYGKTVGKGVQAYGKAVEKGAKAVGKLAKTLGGKALEAASMAVPGLREAVLVMKIASIAKSVGSQVKSMTYEPAQKNAEKCASQSAQII